MRQFRRTMKWIVVIAIIAVAGALGIAASKTELTVHIVAATALGVFFSVVIGLGLVALASFGEKSRRNDAAADSSKPKDGRKR